MPKPTVKTPENQEIILEAIRRGASLTIAADCAGIDPSTLYVWKRESPEFRASLSRARSVHAQKCLDRICGSEDWRAAAWYLERQYPEDFALVHRIEQVLKQYGLIKPGILHQLEDSNDIAEILVEMGTEAFIQKLTTEQIYAVLALSDSKHSESQGSEDSSTN